MKKLAAIALLLLSLNGYSQLGFEEFYTDAQLTAILQQAQTPAGKIEGHGLLAVRYKSIENDSLARYHLHQLSTIGNLSKNVKLKARALWWDNYFQEDTGKAKRYLDFAKRNNLVEEQIAGYIALTKVNIHLNLVHAEQHALSAKKLWTEWKQDSTAKDSLKVEVSKQLAHVYIHKRNGVQAVSYLLPMQDYATQERNLSLKESALNGLSDMYYEWPGQYKKPQNG